MVNDYSAHTSQPQASMPVPLGAISFINTLPVYGAFHWNTVLAKSLNVNLVYDVPSGLNRKVDDAQLLVSPVSSAYYLRNQDKLTLLNNLSVSSYGAVESVIFCSKKPLDKSLFELEKIAVPDDSETSVALLSCLIAANTNKAIETIDFKNWFNVYPAQDYQTALDTYGAALIIGDNALQVYQSNTREAYYLYDLSSLWVEKYKTPFVFAVWVAQTEWAEQNPQALSCINHQLIENYQTFLKNDSLIADGVTLAQQYCKLPADVIKRYFTQCLDYSLTPEHQQTLVSFSQLLHQLDATPKTLVGGQP